MQNKTFSKITIKNIQLDLHSITKMFFCIGINYKYAPSKFTEIDVSSSTPKT